MVCFLLRAGDSSFFVLYTSFWRICGDEIASFLVGANISSGVLGDACHFVFVYGENYRYGDDAGGNDELVCVGGGGFVCSFLFLSL